METNQEQQNSRLHIRHTVPTVSVLCGTAVVLRFIAVQYLSDVTPVFYRMLHHTSELVSNQSFLCFIQRLEPAR